MCLVMQSEITANSNMAAQLLLSNHSIFVNCMTKKEWTDMGATHESDLLYKAQEMRTNLKKLMTVMVHLVCLGCSCCHVVMLSVVMLSVCLRVVI